MIQETLVRLTTLSIEQEITKIIDLKELVFTFILYNFMFYLVSIFKMFIL